jgi:hypothetical protein
MGIYYFINTINKKLGSQSSASTHCRTFLLGSMLYIGIFIYLHYLSGQHNKTGLFQLALFLTFLVDIGTMAFLYKSFYQKMISNDFDKKYNKTHKYESKPSFDYYNECKKEKDQVQKINQGFSYLSPYEDNKGPLISPESIDK